jgi:hypothetical protein
MKQPKPDRLVEIDGIPITVHSAAGREGRYKYLLRKILTN